MHGITSPMEDRRTTSSADVKGDAATLQPPLPMLTMPEQPPLPSLQPISAQPAPADSTLVEHSSELSPQLQASTFHLLIFGLVSAHKLFSQLLA